MKDIHGRDAATAFVRAGLGMALALTLAALPQTLLAQQSGSSDEGDAFVHPFFGHMALADPVGEASVRVTGIQVREGADIHGDMALHVEAGLLPRLGLHVRTDGIRSEQTSEAMLMYNLLVSRDGGAGISVFGQLDVPTGRIEENRYRGLVGVGLKETFGRVAVFNGDVHYAPSDDMAEYEGSFVFRASDLLYPVIEGRGEIRSGEATSFYFLPALKLRSGRHEIGFGFQFGAAGPTEYDVQALLQYGIEF